VVGHSKRHNGPAYHSGVIDCARCGTANPEGSRFCNSCGASLVARVGVQERRVVTALFADLARSTALGESLDPEVVRGVVGDFFDLARTEIQRRGGAVEKFSGDAVMAIFGLPQAHEDDPERAVRAAVAIRDGLGAVATQARERHGIDVRARIGIESGEVVVGDPFGGATMATGDAMNLAARLEQQAEPGEIVVGEMAHGSVRDIVDGQPLGELTLRGHEAALRGWRVTAIADEVGRPRGVPGLHAPLTGRDEELNLVLDAGRRALHGRKPVLFTVLGTPGVGKSRLIREAAERMAVDGWTTVRGRCLPYGEGITYWAAAEIVRGVCGIDSDMSTEAALARLSATAPEEDVARRLALMLGIADASADSGSGGDREIAFGFRRLIEHVAAGTPLIVVFEDVHWAEPPLLDLIEYLATWARDVALLIACTSRPELLDSRGSWGSGRMETSRISLEPLSEDDSRSLLSALLAVDDLPAELRQRVLDRSEGNPLFVEEVVRMLIEEGVVVRKGEHWQALPAAADVRVPDSVEALIRARLDTLPSPERAVLQAASVVGRVFQRSAVSAISPAGGSIDMQLEEAMLRDLITEERVPDEPTFRFRHVLIRDVAYATLPKARRATLHRAVADWLRAWAGPRIEEFVEIEAYHLEQSVRLQRELEGRAEPAALAQALTALETSARRASLLDDSRAARSFAERALALDPEPGIQRMELEALLAQAFSKLGDYREAAEIADRLERDAAAAGRKDLQGRAILIKAGDLWVSLESSDADGALSELRRARVLLTEAGDDRTLIDVMTWIGYGGWWHGNMKECEEAWEEVRRIAHENGWLSREAEGLVLLARSWMFRNNPERVVELLDEAAELAQRGPSRLARARRARSVATRNRATQLIDRRPRGIRRGSRASGRAGPPGRHRTSSRQPEWRIALLRVGPAPGQGACGLHAGGPAQDGATAGRAG
jgi:class 3 adenylate cyclase/tetratricopeptide (TPR) repeat protein